MKKAALVFPHQLFEDCSHLRGVDLVFLIEDFLYFRQYKFHKKKLVLHRASMKRYEKYLSEQGFSVVYVESQQCQSRGAWASLLKQEGIQSIVYSDVVDAWLAADLQNVATKLSLQCDIVPTQLFINTKEDNDTYFSKHKKPFMKIFYEWQRKRLQILVDEDGIPEGGVFLFDTENRKKLPKDYVEPPRFIPDQVSELKEAQNYVATHFSNNYGSVERFEYAIDFDGAKQILEDFLENRLRDFGVYEDAISSAYTVINHSVLTPYLNCGLLTPAYVVERVLVFAAVAKHDIPINSLEGFVRQIIGWREFMRAMYELHGVKMRTTNFFGHTKRLSESFWDGTTGNKVVDTTIKRTLEHAYCHHIERLMILGNYMLLSEYDPDNVYRWFMELFIDSYDWVMVPNVYGMSQFADGGIFATKPYICASNYIYKMSDYKKDDMWDVDFDTKFWTFLKKHRVFFSKNPRFSMLLKRVQ